jgi:signal peptidase II
MSRLARKDLGGKGISMKSLRFGLAIVLGVALADQAAKWSILTTFHPAGAVQGPFSASGHIVVLPILDFVLTWNRGVSFGVGNNGGAHNALLFTLLSAVIAAALVGWMARTTDRLVLLALGLVVGGAVGNAVDRLRFGAVVDFIYVHVGAFDWWPAMNLADWAISVGAVLLVFDSLYAKRDSHKNTP